MDTLLPSARRAPLAGLVGATAFFVLAAAALAQPAITLTPLGTGGVVSAPLHVTSPNDGSGRIFVVSQEGVIKIFHNGAYLSAPFLDISSLVTYEDEQGLLSMVFHPDYADNGWFYVYYVDNLTTPGSVTIARYTVSSDPNVADPSSAQIVPGRAGPVRRHAPRRPARVRPGRLSLRRHRRFGRRGRSRQPRTEHVLALRKAAPARRERDGRGPCGADGSDAVRRPADQPVRGRRRRLRGDLGVRLPQPLALQLRSRDGRPVHRRRG